MHHGTENYSLYRLDEKTSLNKRLLRYVFPLILIILFPLSLYAQDDDDVSAASGIAETQNQAEIKEQYDEKEQEEVKIGYNLLRNKYFLESLRLKNSANLALLEGEYDQCAWYSQEAIRYAELSDEYINSMLLQQKANKAITQAASQIAWAKNAQAEKYYPSEFKNAKENYDAAIAARSENKWQDALDSALLAAYALEGVAEPPTAGVIPKDMPKNPTSYKVRPWDLFGDCLWNISKWFYGDYRFWTAIYEVNKEKLPDPNNPDLIEVGTILDIPSIRGEERAGYWDSGKSYTAPGN